MLRPRSAVQPSIRRGFTMVELMVVVVVIAILIGLLLPAITSATRNVRVTSVQGDIKQLEAAISNFKTIYQMNPPSRIVLWENPGTANGWNTMSPSNDALASRELLRQMWPRFNFALQRDLDGDGAYTTNPIVLTGGECLVFFLGGMLQRDTTTGRVAPVGFSKDPLNPFIVNPSDPLDSSLVSGNREGPFFEFKTDRFIDTNNNSFPEYLDPIPGQKVPYLYYSSYEGAGYRQRNTTATVAEFFNSTTYPRSPYRNGTKGTSAPFNQKTFQIISPGFDQEFGPAGPFDPKSNSGRLPAYTIDLNGDGDTSDTGETVAQDIRGVEKDNITNFHSGMLDP